MSKTCRCEQVAERPSCTMTRTTLALRDETKPDTPLRLDVAARIAFPDGPTTVSGPRREGARGRLVIAEVNPRA
jgi:hypothetical protein